jgi:hypothetical protein
VLFGFVGAGLVFFGVAFIVLPVEGDEPDLCGIAPAMVAALGVDDADRGYEDWCRTEARLSVALGLILTVPGVLLFWLAVRGRVEDAPAPPGSPGGDDPTSCAPPRDAQPPDDPDSREPTSDTDPPRSQ